MSGHSKWSQIKHKKGIADQKKGQLFSKLGKLVSITAKNDPNPDTNMRLQAVIGQARAINMPKENIERAIKRASDKNAAALFEIAVQALGPAGSAFVIESVTDNKNRTINELKTLLQAHGGHMVDEGSLNWMFDRVAILRATAHGKNEELELALIEAGADDIERDEDALVITGPSQKLATLKHALEESGITVQSAELEMTAKDLVAITDDSAHKQIEALLEDLDGHDDVNDVWSNISLGK